MIHRRQTTPASRQSGAVLIIALVMLLAVTLLGLGSTDQVNMGIKMANNTQAARVALSNAEKSVSDGERDLVENFDGTPLFDWSSDTGDGRYTIGDLADTTSVLDFETVSWDEAPTGTPLVGDGYQVGANDESRYTMEYLGPYTTAGASLAIGTGGGTDSRYIYRITGFGEAGIGGARLVQTIYGTRD